MPNQNQKSLPGLYLASTSARRRQILESLGVPFFVISPVSDESQPDSESVTAECVNENARLKAQSILSRIGANDIAIGADTVVGIDGKVLGKPQSKEDAREKLLMLSGRGHTVYTGLFLCHQNGASFMETATSRVFFRRLGAAEIESYIQTKEPYDKAGAYAVQGLATLFIDRIEGSYTNVMGFPLELFLRGLPTVANMDLVNWFR